MRKWSFVIIPIVGLGIFSVFYMGALKRMDERDAAAEAEKARIEQEEIARQQEIQAQTKIQQAEAAAKARAEEAAKLAKQESDWAAAGRELQDAITIAELKIADSQDRAVELTNELKSLRTQRQEALQAKQGLWEQIEAAKIQVRNNEIESERLNDILLRFVDNSSVTAMPPPLPVPGR